MIATFSETARCEDVLAEHNWELKLTDDLKGTVRMKLVRRNNHFYVIYSAKDPVQSMPETTANADGPGAVNLFEVPGPGIRFTSSYTEIKWTGKSCCMGKFQISWSSTTFFKNPTFGQEPKKLHFCGSWYPTEPAEACGYTGPCDGC